MGMKQAKAHRSKKCYEEEVVVERVVAKPKLPLDEETSGALPDFNDNDKSAHSHNKTQKTTKRKRKSHDDADDGNNNNNSNDNDDSSSSNLATTTTSRYAQKKSEKAQLKLQLQSQIPTHDPETGIPYNKIQVRRMMRRVKHGLPPIPTEEEEAEIRAREKRERMEEEALMYAERRNDNEDASNLEDAGDDNHVNSEDDGENKNDDNDIALDDNGNMNEEDDVAKNDSDDKQTTFVKTTTPPTKKAKRSKPVPSDYICQACQNKPTSPSSSSFVPHWIYDCPAKKVQRGCNQVSKKLRGLHDPPSHKVFVSGLPFECDEGMVKRFFEKTMGKNDANNNTNVATEVVHCKLLKFEDSNRCKGQAFLTFDSEEGAKLAIRVVNGSTWKEIVEPGMAAKGKKKKIATAEGGAKKELKLKVTKALNRFVTKNKTGMGKV